MTLEQKVSYFARSIAHDKYVIAANKDRSHINKDKVGNEKLRKKILKFHKQALAWNGEMYLSYTNRWISSFSPIQAISYVFGSHAAEAINVAGCESHFSVYATNGQYLGMFQMGDYARGKYGHSNTPYGQAVAAHKYFMDSGWSPWECKPW